MAYPTDIDNFSNKTDGVDYPQAADINVLNDAIEAIETKVGVDDSAVATSIDYIIQNKIWPIGSVFTSVVSTNPNTLLGFGTWTQFGQGTVLVGQNGGDADFDTPLETGGSKIITLAEANLPAHVHTVDPPSTLTSTESQSHNHAGKTNCIQSDTAGGSYASGANTFGTGAWNTGDGSRSHVHAIDIGQFNSGSVGSGTAKSVMNPYTVVYFFQRTA
jgi:hypothetical protein